MGAIAVFELFALAARGLVAEDRVLVADDEHVADALGHEAIARRCLGSVEHGFDAVELEARLGDAVCVRGRVQPDPSDAAERAVVLDVAVALAPGFPARG